MSELQQENPDAWKVEKAKKDFDPGVYDQILKEYPGIQVDPHPGRKEKPIVTYNGKSIDFGMRFGPIRLQEIRENFGEPAKESQNTAQYSPGFSIGRIETRALNRLEKLAELYPTKGRNGAPAINVLLNEGYESVITDDYKNGIRYPLPRPFTLPSDVLNVEYYNAAKTADGTPVTLRNTLNDGSYEFITIYKKPTQ